MATTYSAEPVGKAIWRPFLLWIAASAALFAVKFHLDQVHHATIRFTASMEGRSDRPKYRATVNDAPFDSGLPSGLGHRMLRIECDGAQHYSTNIFVGYGGKNLGNINLKRARGTLDLTIKPAAERIIIQGKETNILVDAVSHDTWLLPTDPYSVITQFPRFTTTNQLTIDVDRVLPLLIDPGITALSLASEPTNSEFALASVTHPEITIHSNTPSVLTGLPAGEYTLGIWQSDYRKRLSVKLNYGEGTNELTVKFDYAQLTIESHPQGADVFQNRKRLGVTPTTLNLKPGDYRFVIVKDGFRSTNFSLSLNGTEPRAISVKLPNLAFLNALEQAREELSAVSPRYERARALIEDALKIEPDDPAALALKTTVEFQQHIHNAREFETRRDFAQALREIRAALSLQPEHPDALALQRTLVDLAHDAAEAAAIARREHPVKVFAELSSRHPNNELFAPQLMRFTNSLFEVHEAIVRALARKPAWKVGRDEATDPDTAVIQAGLWSFTERQSVVLVAGQTSTNEVAVHFKIFHSVLDTKVQINLTGVSDDSYVPLHPQRVSALRAPFAGKQRTAAIQEFRKRIEDELR